jgi:hypothetical protein
MDWSGFHVARTAATRTESKRAQEGAVSRSARSRNSQVETQQAHPDAWSLAMILADNQPAGRVQIVDNGAVVIHNNSNWRQRQDEDE